MHVFYIMLTHSERVFDSGTIRWKYTPDVPILLAPVFKATKRRLGLEERILPTGSFL